MHTALTIARSRAIDHLMDAKTQNIRRVELDPQERKALVQGLSEARAQKAELQKCIQSVDYIIARFEWLLQFDHLENLDHDGTDRSIGAGCAALDGVSNGPHVA